MRIHKCIRLFTSTELCKSSEQIRGECHENVKSAYKDTHSAGVCQVLTQQIFVKSAESFGFGQTLAFGPFKTHGDYPDPGRRARLFAADNNFRLLEALGGTLQTYSTRSYFGADSKIGIGLGTDAERSGPLG